MSDPSLVQISFKIKPEMPYDMKKFILSAFTDYYEKYYPKKTLSVEECLRLRELYPVIGDLTRNDAYHNIDFQTCQLDEWFVYDIDNNEILHDEMHRLDENGNEIPNDIPKLGVSIVSLPRNPEVVDEFLKLVGPYIYSEVSTIGICHYYDYGKTVAYYYFDKKNNICKHMIKTNKNDEILYDNNQKVMEINND